MERFLILLLITCLAGCQNHTGPSTDPAQNRYYSSYSQIYNNLGKLPADSIQNELHTYLQEFPENAGAQMLMGNLYYAQANYKLATDYYNKAIALNPAQCIYHVALGNVYTIQNKLDLAENELNKAVSLHDTTGRAFLALAMLNVKKNKKKKSLAYADSAFRKSPPSAVVFSALSYVYGQWHDTARANNLFSRAVTLGLKDTTAFKEVLTGKKTPEDYYRIYY